MKYGYFLCLMNASRRLLLERITENSEILGGKPIVRERWIPVEQVIGCLADGFSYEDLMQAHPTMGM
jgi:uncharacterized protein (DUF433 family)